MNRMKQAFKAIARFCRAVKGSAATEFALVVPFYLILFIGFFEAGRLMNDYHVVSKAVRDGARYAARLPADCAGFDDAANDLRIKRLTRTGTIDGTAAPLLDYWTDDATVTVTIGCYDNTAGTYSGAYSGVDQVPTMKVNVALPFNFLFVGYVSGVSVLNLTFGHSEPHIGL